MFLFLYIVILCSNFLFVKSEDNVNLTIDVKHGVNCSTTFDNYTFTEGQNLTLVVKPNMNINKGWWNLITANSTKELYGLLKSVQNPINGIYEPILYTSLLDNSTAGEWEFKFYYFKNNIDYLKYAANLPRITDTDGSNYTMTICRTNVKIVPAPIPTPLPTPSAFSELKKFIIIASAVGAFLLIIIIAQAAYIFCLKNKAQKLITLNTHNNLSKKSESIPNDTARYCSNPGQKIMKAPIPEEDNNRDSVIYEAPNIEIPSNNCMPMQPPQPPAINTMPRTPRPDHHMKIDRQEMLAAALSSPSRSRMPGTLPPNFQRSNYEREVSVANRPPLPLPPQGHPHNDVFQEVYEEMETEENTYELPPVINTLPPRLPMPPKKVPTGNLLDVKENTLKSRIGNKPPVTPKPLPQRSNVIPNQPMSSNELEQARRRRNNSDTIPRANTAHMVQPQQPDQSLKRRPNGDVQPNELEEALRRRNVKQVPIQSIPDPSSRSSPKPKPALKSKPPPVRHPVQEEIYYNEASSDEEWTYEPLKPLNSYDPNIYNV